MTSSASNRDRPTSVAAVMKAKREERAAKEQRCADAQEHADKRPAQGWGTT